MFAKWTFFRARIFSKLLKPMYSALRKLGHTNVAYIDDSFLQSDTYEECVQNVSDTLQLADDLGFTVHKKKSVVVPTQQTVFVGFLICSVTMTVRLPHDKCLDMIELCKEILASHKITIRKFAQLICKCVSVEPGVRYAAIYYKSMEIERDEALKIHRGNFDAVIYISNEIDSAFSGGLKIFKLHSDSYVYQNLTAVSNLIVQALAGVVMTLLMM